MTLAINQVQNWDWRKDPVSFFQLLERLHEVIYPVPFGQATQYFYSKGFDDYVIAWSDSGDYIGRAFCVFTEGKEGLQQIWGDSYEFDRTWWKLRLSEVPQQAKQLLQHYHAAHIAAWVATLDDVLGLGLPDNHWQAEEGLYFSPQGTLIFSWEDSTRAFKPIDLGISQPKTGIRGVSGLSYKLLKPKQSKKSVVSVAQT